MRSRIFVHSVLYFYTFHFITRGAQLTKPIIKLEDLSTVGHSIRDTSPFGNVPALTGS